MKVALTIWENRISPVFDAAHMFLVAEIEDAKVINKHLESFDPEMPSRLADRLIKLDIKVMICGAITQMPANIIEGIGIKLIPFISGVADEVLSNYARGLKLVPKYSMPGCGRRYRRRCRPNDAFFLTQKKTGVMPKRDGGGPYGHGAESIPGRYGSGSGRNVRERREGNGTHRKTRK